MGYGYPHPVSGMPASFGVPGWGYAPYEQAEPMARGPAMPGYYADPAAYGAGARAPGGPRDRAAEKYGQGSASSEGLPAQAAQVWVLFSRFPSAILLAS